MIPIDSAGKTIKSDISQLPSKQVDTSRRFSPSGESTLGAIARNLYKPVRETGSALLGGIPTVWNALAGLGGKVSEYITPEGLEPTELPQFPEEYTISGRREQIFKPIGESLFGEGSQEPQPGIIEGLTERASEILPWALLGGGGLGAAVGTSALQAAGGETAKALGGGQGMQMVGELLGGLAPAAAKLTTKGIAKLAAPAEKTAFSQARAEIAAATAAEKNLIEHGTDIQKSINKMRSSLSEESLKKTTTDINALEGLLGTGELTPENTYNMAKKIGDLSGNMTTKTGKKFVYGIKESLDKAVDTISKTYPEARGITSAIKSHEGISKAIENAKRIGVKSDNIVKQTVKFGAIGAGFKFGGGPGAAATAALVLGAEHGADIIQNVKFLKANPALRNLIGNTIKDISVRNFSAAARNLNRISEEFDSKKKTKKNMTMIPIS